MTKAKEVSVAKTLWNQRIPMRDGMHIAVDMLLPEGIGPFPTVLSKTPYGRGNSLKPGAWIRLVEQGFALVVADIRGRNDSEGEWIPWAKDSEDSYDLIQWLTEQPWCNGKVGMVGGSYVGKVQWWATHNRHPALSCIAPLCIGGSSQVIPYGGTGIPAQYWLWWMNLVNGKTPQYRGAPSWEDGMPHLPLKTLDHRLGLESTAWQRYVRGQIEYTSAAATLTDEDYARIDIPVLIGVGWWDDQFTMQAWEKLQQAKSAAECRLLIGAWDHAGNTAPRPMLGGEDVSASVMDTVAYIERFLARHLKGETDALAEAPRCRIFRTGANRWDAYDRWPHVGAEATPFYLDSDGDARSLRGNGRLSRTRSEISGHDTYTYDPHCPGRDMSNLSMFAFSDPILDHRYLHRRRDILVYDTEPLTTRLLLSGRIRLQAFVSSDRPDTDLYLGICDVHPDGRAISLSAKGQSANGSALRLRYRNGPEPALLTPHQVVEVVVNGVWLHHQFNAGHRIRITIHSGAFPVMSRNAGSGGHWAEDEVLYPQTNTVYHGPDYPSQVILPVVKGEPCRKREVA